MRFRSLVNQNYAITTPELNCMLNLPSLLRFRNQLIGFIRLLNSILMNSPSSQGTFPCKGMSHSFELKSANMLIPTKYFLTDISLVNVSALM